MAVRLDKDFAFPLATIGAAVVSIVMASEGNYEYAGFMALGTLVGVVRWLLWSEEKKAANARLLKRLTELRDSGVVSTLEANKLYLKNKL